MLICSLITNLSGKCKKWLILCLQHIFDDTKTTIKLYFLIIFFFAFWIDNLITTQLDWLENCYTYILEYLQFFFCGSNWDSVLRQIQIKKIYIYNEYVFKLLNFPWSVWVLAAYWNSCVVYSSITVHKSKWFENSWTRNKNETWSEMCSRWN